MIPGNRPEDEAFDELFDWLSQSGLTAEEIRRRVGPVIPKGSRGSYASQATLAAAKMPRIALASIVEMLGKGYHLTAVVQDELVFEKPGDGRPSTAAALRALLTQYCGAGSLSREHIELAKAALKGDPGDEKLNCKFTSARASFRLNDLLYGVSQFDEIVEQLEATDFEVTRRTRYSGGRFL